MSLPQRAMSARMAAPNACGASMTMSGMVSAQGNAPGVRPDPALPSNKVPSVLSKVSFEQRLDQRPQARPVLFGDDLVGAVGGESARRLGGGECHPRQCGHTGSAPASDKGLGSTGRTAPGRCRR